MTEKRMKETSEKRAGNQRTRVCKVLSIIILSSIMVTTYFLVLHYSGKQQLDKQERTNKLGSEIRGDYTIGQSFCPEDPLFCGISVKIATFSRRNNGPLLFSLFDADNPGRPVYEYYCNTFVMTDNSFHYFPIPLRKDNHSPCYYFNLSSPQDSEGNAVSVWYHSEDKYVRGTRYESGQESSGDLSFRIYRWLPLSQLLVRVISHKPFPIFLFPVFVSLMIVLTVMLVIFLFHRAYRASTSNSSIL